ncbi:4Fe-4S dicluster domain-containing protein [Desulfofundulus thermosubterraneus]|uniref:Na+-translocating ferredoxin:NAD+ oxidoreductase RNF, RnfC subunit n=1 Tax=Desulfofundulus thermosubterraneus DSM 16057 TaxID=1121432 RepID=A0A1M6DWT0_9FIRM|nr:4Fe-4S dicluster domain-containing protein [Desulfofundulus thermosubterraneus]SHI77671.1 Na+-translocating ferredoxin:NAD+ oxidoreductase RNF, RnfC subunit [Desulfofundulus thermosubterraneus DSM 16057]
MIAWSREEIISRLRQSGVVGAGGAGFPAYMKASSRAEWVIANAAECEPLLRGNQELLRCAAREVIGGLKIMMRATGAVRAAIGIKAKYKAAAAALQEALAGEPETAVELHFLDDFYPAGDEHVLVYEVTGRVIPPGGIPIQVGVVVNNVETLFNVNRAMEGRPVIEKIVTMTGAVQRPVTLQVPVGTPVKHLLHLAGGPQINTFAIIEGGPMMGRLVDLDAVVTRTTGGIIVLPADHPLVLSKKVDIGMDLRRTRGMCCHCGYCTELCPRYLLGHGLRPDRNMAGLAYATGELVAGGAPWLCSECGLCEVFACPMELSPRRVNAWLKRQMSRSGFKPPGGELHGLHPQRSYRRVPTARLVARLGLSRYDIPAPLQEESVRPQKVRLMLKQHTGVPAEPVVEPGERVAAGQVVAEVPDNALGVPIHASIEGRVAQVSADAVVIESERVGEGG